MDKQLTANFALSEFLRSETAVRHDIDMTPPAEIRANLQHLCESCLQPLREHLGKPIYVTSGYRPPALNALIGGASDSYHMRGLAADIHTDGMTPLELCRFAYAHGLPYAQIIHEFGAWCHLAAQPIDHLVSPRLLTAQRLNGRTTYTVGLTEISA